MNSEKLFTLKMSSVLLIDDSKNTRKKISNLLSFYFSKIYEGTNGIDGLEIYNNHKPSLIITDINMPKMNGLTFIEKIREFDSNIPIIIISKSPSIDILLKAVKFSLTDYLLKPVEHEQLIASLLKAAELIKATKLFGEIKIRENCVYDATNKQLIIDRKYYHLSKSEICLLELFLSNKDMIVTKDMIESNYKPSNQKSSCFYYYLIHNLRKKIGKNSIVNVSKSGYILV